MSKWQKAIQMTAFLMGLSLSMSGCVEAVPPQPSTAPVGNSLQKAMAHNDSADSNVKLVKPHADKTGQEIIDIVVGEHKQVKSNLVDANSELTKVNKDYQKVLDAKNADDKQIDVMKHSIWYKAYIWFNAFKTFIIAAAIIHVVCLALAVAFPVYAIPFRLVATILNPFAWLVALFNWLGSKRVVTVTQTK